MVGCRQTSNSALGGGNIFQKRGSCQTYPTGYLVLTSPKIGAIEISGVSPLSVTMQLKVGAPVGDLSDWGTLTGWCVSWGDGTQSTGSFGSATPDYQGFMYFVASNISHTYRYDDTTTQYTSRAYRPWATISDTCGNEIVVDYGQYIHVCRSDSAPDKTGGCSQVIPEIPEIIGTPPKTVCTHGAKLCVRDTGYDAAVGYLCDNGGWSFDPAVTTECWAQNPKVVPIVCAEGNIKCESSVLYTCKNNAYVAGGACKDTPTATVDEHGCIIGSATWCEYKGRCVQTGIESCCGTGTKDIHGCICNDTTWCEAEKMCKGANMACGSIGVGTYDNHGCLIASQKWCDTDGACKSLSQDCTISTHYRDGKGCWVDLEHWCNSDGICKPAGQLCTVSELTDQYGCLHGEQTWCAAENKCKMTGDKCGTTTTPITPGDGGIDDILSGQTAGIDNKMLLMGGVAVLGALLLFGGSRAARKE